MRRLLDLDHWPVSSTKPLRAGSIEVDAEKDSRRGKSTQASAIGSRFFERFCRIFFRIYSPLTVEGRENLPAGAFLLCSNHTSHADSAALMTASGRTFDSFALLGASDYFFYSRTIRYLVSSLMNVIPIDRRPGPKSLISCLATCQQFVKDTGGSLILYPEGTRSPDGEMKTFRPGVGLFAIALGLPIVPAYIEGTHQILPKGRCIPRFGPVKVRFGEPLRLADLPWSSEIPRERRRYVVARLAQSVEDLSARNESEKLLVSAHKPR